MDKLPILPATVPATAEQKRLALTIALLVPIPFIAILPIGHIQLPRVDSYIPVTNTVILINDTITATLLLAHFSITRSPSLLALAAGFLYTAFLIVPHALTLPGAFAPNGLLGANLQTPAWLNEIWHLGLPSAVIAYALLRRIDGVRSIQRGAVRVAIITTVIGVFAVTCGLVWLTTAGVELLPPIMTDLLHSQASWDFLPPVALSIIALGLLWSRRYSALDLCLLIVIEIWMFDALLFYTMDMRYTLLWYGGRAFATFAASLVLLYLLSETTVLYGRLARSHALLERERGNRLMNIEATTAAIAHEISQPLTAMLVNAEASLALLGKSPPDLPGIKEALEDIVIDGHRTGNALDGIRALFRKTNEGRQRVDMNEIVLSVLHALRGELNDQGVIVQTELTSEMPLIDGNRGQLQQLLFNLAQNAVEAMGGTTNRSRVLRLVTQHQDSDTIVVAVQDTGPGIVPQQLDRIFEAFLTTKSQGTGLGLAICRAIVERHGGKLSAYSDGKDGALFQFVLPIESDSGITSRPD